MPGALTGAGADVKMENVCAGRAAEPQYTEAGVAGDAIQKRRRRWLRFAAYAALISFFLSLTAFNLVDPDIWHEMALIRESLRLGHLPTRDVFAYTPTVYPSIHHEWGSGLVAYGLTHWFDGNAILIVKYLIAFLIGSVALRCAESLGADVQGWAVLCPIAIYLSQFGFLSVVRAQVYTFLFVACCFWLFEQDRHGSRRWVIAWLCIFPVWVNVHGGFVVGIGLLALYVLERAILRQPFLHLLLLLAASVIEVFINPFGAAYFTYIARALAMSRPHIQEWRPVWAYGPWWTTVFIAALVIATYAVAKIGVRRAPGLLMVVATAIEATLHCKLMPLFAIAWISHVPAYVQPTPVGQWIISFSRRRFAFVFSVWLLVTTMYLADAVRWQFWRLRVSQTNTTYAYPVGAVEYLRERGFVGNLMVPFHQGAYVSWKLYPAVKVSVDSRYEVAYSEEWVDRTFRFYAADPGWQETMNVYSTDLALIPRIMPVARVIQQSGWQMVYEDREFEIFARPGLILPFTDRSSESFAGVFP
jgi:hypothetical protein